MPSPRMRCGRTIAIAIAALVLGSACGPEHGVIEPDPPTDSVLEVMTRSVTCSVDVAGETVRCHQPSPTVFRTFFSTIIGGQGTNVLLSSSNETFDAATGIFQADVTVQNLLGVPMGTPDGSTVTGIRVFFHAGPSATSGSGAVTVENSDGTRTFTASNQPYFEYGQILQPTEVSTPRTWQWRLRPRVTAFNFEVLIDADI